MAPVAEATGGGEVKEGHDEKCEDERFDMVCCCSCRAAENALAKRVEELTKAAESLCERVRQTLPGLAIRSNLLASQIEARVEAVERLVLDSEDAERRAGRAK